MSDTEKEIKMESVESDISGMDLFVELFKKFDIVDARVMEQVEECLIRQALWSLVSGEELAVMIKPNFVTDDEGIRYFCGVGVKTCAADGSKEPKLDADHDTLEKVVMPSLLQLQAHELVREKKGPAAVMSMLRDILTEKEGEKEAA